VLEQEKKLRKLTRHKEQVQKRLNKNKDKVKLQRKAKRSEDKAGENIIKATKNSGRSFKDGDFTTDDITLDNKLQTTRINPLVKLEEMAKVKADAQRAGNQLSGLILENKNGSSFVVLTLEDFSKLLSMLIKE
jgi:hypothetical protein